MNTTHATEFRVGNLFRFISTDSIEQVADIRTAGIKTPTINNVLIDDIEPIPLNEDWLVRFGFENEIIKPSTKHGSYFSKHYTDCKYSFSFAEFRNDWGFYHSYTDAGNEEDNNRFDFVSCGIKYVHQLQNLYFALTGTELTLTDK